MAHRIAATGLVVFVSGLAVLPSAHAAKPPPPRFARSLVAVPAGGTVTVKAHGKRRAVKLRRATSVGFGATIDATRGTVRLVAAAAAAAPPPGRRRRAAAPSRSPRPRPPRARSNCDWPAAASPAARPTARRSATRQLRVRTSGRFTTRSCFGRVRLKCRRAATARAAAASRPTGRWSSIPGGWRIRLVSNPCFEVTDLKTGEVKLVRNAGLYEYIYEPPPRPAAGYADRPSARDAARRPAPRSTRRAICCRADSPPARTSISAPRRSPSRAGSATFTVEAYVAFAEPARPAGVRALDDQPDHRAGELPLRSLLSTAPPACPAGRFAVSRLTSGPPYRDRRHRRALATRARTSSATPCRSRRSAARAFSGSRVVHLRFTDRIPDTGFLSYPRGHDRRRRGRRHVPPAERATAASTRARAR